MLVEIAADLVISVKTASVHVSRILRKLGLPSRTDAARIVHPLAPPPFLKERGRELGADADDCVSSKAAT